MEVISMFLILKVNILCKILLFSGEQVTSFNYLGDDVTRQSRYDIIYRGDPLFMFDVEFTQDYIWYFVDDSEPLPMNGVRTTHFRTDDVYSEVRNEIIKGKYTTIPS